MSSLTLKAKLEIIGTIECLTGLHIGSGREKVEIGEVDSPVVKDLITMEPYIPGSSLKGVMRSKLEVADGKEFEEVVKGSKDRKGIYMHICNESSCNVCSIFGRPAEYVSNYPARLIVRDSYPDDYTRELIRDYKLEVKFENQLDRITAAANPRQIERVPKGSRFNLSMIYNIYDNSDISLLKDVFRSMKLVEDSYLGGHGSRGYGRVMFNMDKLLLKPKKYYTDGKTIESIKIDNRVEGILAAFDEIIKSIDLQ